MGGGEGGPCITGGASADCQNGAVGVRGGGRAAFGNEGVVIGLVLEPVHPEKQRVTLQVAGHVVVAAVFDRD